MPKKILWVCVLGAAVLGACAPNRSLEGLKEELLDIDRAFSKASVEQGQGKAFIEYMASEAVIYPMVGAPIQGKADFSKIITAASSGAPESRLEWEPLFADISLSGDLGYTLGSYIATVFQSEGDPLVRHGHYVTVWKKQSDGNWKFVFDGGNQAAPLQNPQEGK